MSTVSWEIHLPQAIESGPSKSQPATAHPSVHETNEQSSDNFESEISDDIDDPEFDESSRWPRRLLHVPSLTSHKWRPGNTYGGIERPEYSIISYTWGRWRIHDPHSTASALAVQGVPWQIPKIDPKHFTSEQFERILQLMVAHSDERGYWHTKTSWVWLDVACIPQWRNSAVAASEVGRQARIFRGARTAFVWLTTADVEDVNIITDLDLWSSDAGSVDGDSSTDGEIQHQVEAFSRVIADPWFSSMWTMQESFLQDEAQIMTQTGINRTALDRTLNLAQLQLSAGAMCEKKMSCPDLSLETEILLSDFWKKWSQTGLQGQITGASPMHTLAHARFRTSEFPPDRVYGIMQIFGDDFQVGKSRLAASISKATPSHEFTLDELEDELGSMVIEKYPFLSQLFQHEEPPQTGLAWRICGAASVPYHLADASEAYEKFASGGNAAVIQCNLSTQTIGSRTWGTFRGKVCSLTQLVSHSESIDPSFDVGPFHAYLDAGSGYTETATNNVESIVSHFGSDTLMALLLRSGARFSGVVHAEYLLLLRPGQKALEVHKQRRGWTADAGVTGLQAWARVGVCQLEWLEKRGNGLVVKGPSLDAMLGKTNDWEEQEGIWG